MINSVEIRNFKAIKNISLNLSRFNIFVGANNSGKSSVLQAIQFAVGTAQTANKMARNLTKNPISFSASASAFSYLPIKDIEALVHNRNLTQTQGSEVKFTEDDISSAITLKRGKNRNIAASITNSSLSAKIMSPEPYCVITPGVSGISISEEYKTKAVVFKSATRGDSNFYLRNILLLLSRKEDAWQKFITKFHQFFPDYSLEVKFDENSDETIEVYTTTSNSVQLPIDALGTSALQILQILSYIYCFEPKMLILDEPDTHLHPNNQRKLIFVLNEVSIEQDMQILLSTHSRHMIDEGVNIATFFWMQNGSLCKEIPADENENYVHMLLDLGALDKSDFMKNPNIQWVICTEDAKVDREEMLKSIFISSGFKLSECVILPNKGCCNIENAVLLNNFIKQYLPNCKMIVHRDSDYLSDETIDSLKRKMTDKGIFLWCTPGTDIEAIFINTQHIHHIYPELDSNIIEEIITNAKASAKEFSLSKFVNYSGNSTRELDYRKINRECEEIYNQNPNRYFHGKKTLGITKSNLQAILHINPKLFTSSPAIKQEELEQLITA